MTTVSGPLKAVTNQQSSVAQVLVRAPGHRPHGGGVVTPESAPVTVSGGQVRFECIPGPAVLVLTWVGAVSDVVRLVVPATSTATLEECVLAAQVAGEADRSVLECLAGEVVADRRAAREAAQKAEQSAASASSAGEIAVKAQKAALESENNTNMYLSQAESFASAAGISAENSAKSAAQSQASADVARTAQSAAESSASQATSMADTASTQAGLAVDAQSQVEKARKEASKSAQEAKTSASQSMTAAEAAGRSEQKAADSAKTAGTEAQKVTSASQKAEASLEEAQAVLVKTGIAAAVFEEKGNELVTAWNTAEKNTAEYASRAEDAERKAVAAADRSMRQTEEFGDFFREATDSISWAGDKLTVMGKQSPSLRGPKGEPGPEGKPGTVGFEQLTPEQLERLRTDIGAPTWDTLGGKPPITVGEPLGEGAIAIGPRSDVQGLASDSGDGVAIGNEAAAQGAGVAIGDGARAAGRKSDYEPHGVAIGRGATAEVGGIAIGDGVHAAGGEIRLGITTDTPGMGLYLGELNLIEVLNNFTREIMSRLNILEEKIMYL
ncbi:hypothetical protein [Corynebacterium renale]|uniref:Uncharacterized protein n=1 Tax=Corynebacterium renale TaxID=1724 RepID=A0A2A9DNA7_9CORY|nr:hypothetical protein [Corynebacterium renale]PFG27390.1 hypothetical protein ATK06_0446 [Corynebacterium renale]SQI23523.1 putative phage tail fiber protein [Corynebacterium renale]